MSRCVICNFFPYDLSTNNLLGSRSDNKVRLRPSHNEYICDDCFKHISDTVDSYNKTDPDIFEEDILNEIFEETVNESFIHETFTTENDLE